MIVALSAHTAPSRADLARSRRRQTGSRRHMSHVLNWTRAFQAFKAGSSFVLRVCQSKRSFMAPHVASESEEFLSNYVVPGSRFKTDSGAVSALEFQLQSLHAFNHMYIKSCFKSSFTPDTASCVASPCGTVRLSRCVASCKRMTLMRAARCGKKRRNVPQRNATHRA